jgi:hypothetical protein
MSALPVAIKVRTLGSKRLLRRHGVVIRAHAEPAQARVPRAGRRVAARALHRFAADVLLSPTTRQRLAAAVEQILRQHVAGEGSCDPAALEPPVPRTVGACVLRRSRRHHMSAPGSNRSAGAAGVTTSFGPLISRGCPRAAAPRRSRSSGIVYSLASRRHAGRGMPRAR